VGASVDKQQVEVELEMMVFLEEVPGSSLSSSPEHMSHVVSLHPW
jgi:hypothetical protein